MKIVSSIQASSLLALSFAAIVAGCAAPEFKQPDVPTFASYKESVGDPSSPASTTAEGSWKTARPGEAEARGMWWEAFADPVLDRLEEEAIAANADLAAAAARVR
ncbi:MAG: RND transporter, partial [Burkholderiaceae bacterium]